MPYTLRPATDRDLDFAMRIGHEGIRPYVEELWGWDASEQRLRFKESFDPAATRIVRVGDRDVGYLTIHDHQDHVFLSSIYLERSFRSQGLGSEILHDVIARGRSLGKPLRLRVLKPNPAARLYQRLGFQTSSQTDTHIYMEHP